MKIYCISGLGADERAFHALKLKHPMIPVQWITPVYKESLSTYCQRLLTQIDTREEFSLLGVSFGGMVACELNKYIQPQKTIIVSSAASKKELPLWYTVMGKLKVAKWLPDHMLVPPAPVLNYLFGVATPESSALLKNISRDTDRVFARWAIDQITHWQNQYIPENLIRIHGNKDKVMPGLLPEAHLIKDGTHFMIVDKAPEISKVINIHT